MMITYSLGQEKTSMNQDFPEVESKLFDSWILNLVNIASVNEVIGTLLCDVCTFVAVKTKNT